MCLMSEEKNGILFQIIAFINPKNRQERDTEEEQEEDEDKPTREWWMNYNSGKGNFPISHTAPQNFPHKRWHWHDITELYTKEEETFWLPLIALLLRQNDPQRKYICWQASVPLTWLDTQKLLLLMLLLLYNYYPTTSE